MPETSSDPQKEIRQEITRNAIRWCCNIVNEVLSNHGEHLDGQASEHLRDATFSLHRVAREIP